MLQMTIKFLDEEPPKNSKIKQLLFCFTRPIADFLEGLNPEKVYRIYKRRKTLADMNKRDYIEEVAKILYDEVDALGGTSNPTLQKMLCIDEARDIFYERKENGGFDDLNIMV